MDVNDKCVLCGAPAYVGLTRTECSSIVCKNFVQQNKASTLNLDLTEDEVEEVKKKLLDLVNDFAAMAAPIFVLNQWTWAAVGVPTQLNIKDHVIRTINDIEKGYRFWWTECGRIYLVVGKYEDEILADIKLIAGSEDVCINR